jgi:hypothetical protein
MMLGHGTELRQEGTSNMAGPRAAAAIGRINKAPPLMERQMGESHVQWVVLSLLTAGRVAA